MTENEVLNLLQDISGIKYSDEQDQVLRSTGGVRILACAGSGKTTVLTHLIVKRLLTDESLNPYTIMSLTYSREGASEMKHRLNKLLKEAQYPCKLQVMTIHAFYHRLLQKFGYKYNICLDRLQYLKQAVRELKIRLSDDDIATLDSLLALQVNNMLTTDRLLSDPQFTLKISPDDFRTIVLKFGQIKKAHQEIDFDDMQMLVYKLLCVPGFINTGMLEYCHKNLTHYFIDEFQDVSRIQYAILKAIIKEPNNLVVIGDDDQSIYAWRGADPELIRDVAKDYKLTSYVLSTNYRCGGEIVDRAASVIMNNKNREVKGIKSATKQGKVQVCPSVSDVYTQSRQVYNYIFSLLNKGVSPDDIAVISRNNTHLSILYSLLFRSNVFCSVRDDIKLTTTQMYKDVKAILGLLQDSYNIGLVHSTLWKVTENYNKRCADILFMLMETTGYDLKDTVLGWLGACGSHKDMVNGKQLPSYALERLKERYNNDTLHPADETMLLGILRIYNYESDVEKCNYLLNSYTRACHYLYNTEDKRRTLLGYIQYVNDMIERDDVAITLSYMNLLEQFESAPVLEEPRVTLTTVHSAKGKEWKYVALMMDDNVVFPSFSGIEHLLHLDNGVAALNLLEEERRLHYVAMTRAKEELTIFTPSENPSVYLVEAYSKDIMGNNNILSMVDRGAYPNIRFLTGATLIDIPTELEEQKRELDNDIIDDEEADEANMF